MIIVILSFLSFLSVVLTLILKNNWTYIKCKEKYYKKLLRKEQKKQLHLLKKLKNETETLNLKINEWTRRRNRDL